MTRRWDFSRGTFVDASESDPAHASDEHQHVIVPSLGTAANLDEIEMPSERGAGESVPAVLTAIVPELQS